MERRVRNFCVTCNEYRVFSKAGISHLLHLVLTILSFGLWGFIWLILGVISLLRGLRCVTCGERAESVSKGILKAVVVIIIFLVIASLLL